MATGHLNPGYGNPVSKLFRARYVMDNNIPMGSESMRTMQNVSLNKQTLEDIRRQAKEAWTKSHGTGQTSYQDHYAEKFSKVDEFAVSRPTSGGRKNKPHPPMVFLTNRLHYCPGYHNADTTLGKQPYQIDLSVSAIGQHHRAQLKSKFAGNTSTAALNQYKADHEDVEFCENPLQKQVSEALIGRSEENVLGPAAVLQYDGINIHGAQERSYRPRTQASLHRYLKHAGSQELDNLHLRPQSCGPVPCTPPYSGLNWGAALDDLSKRRRRDIANMARVTVRNGQRTRRGDFLMHPEWPPSFTQHRLNGLSSLDMPYSVTTR